MTDYSSTYEAYLTEKDGRFLLYLDEFYLTVLFDSIGISNILKIRAIYFSTGVNKIDEIIYEGKGAMPDIIDIIGMIGGPDLCDKIIINNTIEISFLWWEDAFILADWETISKCIEGQKQIATAKQKDVLDSLTEFKNYYFKLRDNELVVFNPMNLEEFMKILDEAYEEKALKMAHYFKDAKKKWTNE
ncbi:MAG: hypothetical protein ACOYMA_13685 [Bacteroidia bacterium]